MASEDDGMKALGLLIAGHINILLTDQPLTDQGIDYPACCADCCGPCWALRWFMDNDPQAAEQAVKATGNDYDWVKPSGRIDWPVLIEAWSRGPLMCPHDDTEEA